MASAYMQALEDAYTKRKWALSQTAERKIINLYDMTLRDISKDLLKNQSPLKKSYLEGRKKILYNELYKLQMESITAAAYMSTAFNQDLLNEMMKAANVTEAFPNLFKGIPLKTIAMMEKGKLYTDGAGLSKRIWDGVQGNMNMVEGIVKGGLIKGTSAKELAEILTDHVNPASRKIWPKEKLKEKLGKGYAYSKKEIDYNALRLARTSITHAYSLNNRLSAAKNPFADGFIWHSAFAHGRTCAICMERDGRHFTAKNMPYDHPNGLCWEEPMIEKSLEDIGKEIGDWVKGGKNSKLDTWMKREYKGDGPDPKPPPIKVPPVPPKPEPPKPEPPKPVKAKPPKVPKVPKTKLPDNVKKLKNGGVVGGEDGIKEWVKGSALEERTFYTSTRDAKKLLKDGYGKVIDTYSDGIYLNNSPTSLSSLGYEDVKIRIKVDKDKFADFDFMSDDLVKYIEDWKSVSGVDLMDWDMLEDRQIKEFLKEYGYQAFTSEGQVSIIDASCFGFIDDSLTIVRDASGRVLLNQVEYIEKNFSKMTEILKDAGVSKDLIEGIMSRVYNAPENVQKLINKYQDKLKIDTIKAKKNQSWYSPQTKGLTINPKYDSMKESPFETFFHEFGHLIDNTDPNGKMSRLFASPNTGEVFDLRESVELDVLNNRFVKQLVDKADKNGNFYKMAQDGKVNPVLLAEELKGRDNYGLVRDMVDDLRRFNGPPAVQDLYSGMTLNQVEAGWMHETKYWKRRISYNADYRDQTLVDVSSEFFAQTLSDMMVKDNFLPIRTYMPNAVRSVEDIIADLIEDAPELIKYAK